MIIWLSDQGDPSVGIFPNCVQIDWNVGYPTDAKSRIADRAMFEKMFKEYFDTTGRVECLFGDECIECMAVIGEEKSCLECRKRELMEVL